MGGYVFKFNSYLHSNKLILPEFKLVRTNKLTKIKFQSLSKLCWSQKIIEVIIYINSLFKLGYYILWK